MATGKGAHFELHIDGVVVLNPHLRGISTSNESEEVDATVVTSQKRVYEPTYERDRITLRLRANTTTLMFARSAKGRLDVAYVYAPFGLAVGMVEIYGMCNVMRAQSIPNAEPGTLSEIEIELNINSEAIDQITAERVATSKRAS